MKWQICWQHLLPKWYWKAYLWNRYRLGQWWHRNCASAEGASRHRKINHSPNHRAKFQDSGLLGPTYLFSRTERSGADSFWFKLWILRSLGQFSPLKDFMYQSIDEEETSLGEAEIEVKDIATQLRTLIINHLLNQFHQSGTIWKRVVVIHALNECENYEDVSVICNLLCDLPKYYQIRFRLLLTSQDESLTRSVVVVLKVRAWLAAYLSWISRKNRRANSATTWKFCPEQIPGNSKIELKDILTIIISLAMLLSRFSVAMLLGLSLEVVGKWISHLYAVHCIETEDDTLVLWHAP